MFATLAGGFPRPPDATGEAEALGAVLAAQAEAGLEPLVDGLEPLTDGDRPAVVGPGEPPGGDGAIERRPAARWLTAAARPEAAGRAVKQALAGPYSLGWAREPRDAGRRRRLTLAAAEALNGEIRALADAGCPLVQVDETAAHRVGDSPAERRLWVEAHTRLADGAAGTHLGLAILGGSADAAGPATVFEAPFASYLFDLVEGPDNWRLAIGAPLGRGVILGALDHRPGRRDTREILVWAVSYAASSGRVIERLGLSTGGSLVACGWDEARRRIGVLAEAARIAAIADRDERLAALDPRAIDSRSAALGRYTPFGERPRRRPRRPRT